MPSGQAEDVRDPYPTAAAAAAATRAGHSNTCSSHVYSSSDSNPTPKLAQAPLRAPAPAPAARGPGPLRQEPCKLPYDALLLRFQSPALEAAFSRQWTLRRCVYDRGTLLVGICVMIVGSVLQLIMPMLYSRRLGMEQADATCPSIVVSSWIGALSHLCVLLAMGATYLGHRTAVVAVFRVYSALTTGLVLPGCAVVSLTSSKSSNSENAFSAALLRTGIISTWFQAGGFPVPFWLEVPLLAAQVGFHMAMLGPALCADPMFWGSGTGGRKVMGFVAQAGRWLQSLVYGAVGFAGGLAEPSPSCLHLVRFLQAVVAYVAPLYLHYLWESRSRYRWWQHNSRQQQQQQQQQQQGDATSGRGEAQFSEPEPNLPPAMVEAAVALTAGAVAWVLLGLL